MTIAQQTEIFELLCQKLGWRRRLEDIRSNGISIYMNVGLRIGLIQESMGVSPLEHFSAAYRTLFSNNLHYRLQWWKDGIVHLSSNPDNFLLVTRLTIIVAMIEEIMQTISQPVQQGVA